MEANPHEPLPLGVADELGEDEAAPQPSRWLGDFSAHWTIGGKMLVAALRWDPSRPPAEGYPVVLSASGLAQCPTEHGQGYGIALMVSDDTGLCYVHLPENAIPDAWGRAVHPGRDPGRERH